MTPEKVQMGRGGKYVHLRSYQSKVQKTIVEDRQWHVGLDKLFVLSYLLFYSHILKILPIILSKLPIILSIILKYSSNLMVESGQNDHRTLQFYTTTKQYHY